MSTRHLLGRLALGLAVAAVPTLAASQTFAGVDPTIMTMTAEDGDTARLGKHITVAFNDGYTVDGTHFDIWVCPDTTLRPVDGGDNNGECQALTFWARSEVTGYDQQTTARTMSWLLTTEDSVPGLQSPDGTPYLNGSDPIMMSTPDGGWCAYSGQYLITHDYDTAEGTHGGHSNFLQIASDCDVVLPETGSSTMPYIATALALLLGGAFVSMRRIRIA
jgi:LPXTG-motif cell wall-anchored protein